MGKTFSEQGSGRHSKKIKEIKTRKLKQATDFAFFLASSSVAAPGKFVDAHFGLMNYPNDFNQKVYAA